MLKNPYWIYYGMFLDDKSKNKLINTFASIIPEGWRVIAEHMTVIYNDKSENAEQWASLCEKQVGTTAVLMGTHIGISDRAIALRVIGYQSNNANPHITIAVAPGAKPVESNQITDWQKLETPIYLGATLQSYDKPRSMR